MDQHTKKMIPSVFMWGIAGVPILATLVQAILTAQGTPASAAGLSSLAQPLHQVQVFREASLIFWQSPELASGLFVLIGVAWVSQGAFMLSGQRDATFGSAFLVSVLFFALYILIYLPLLGQVPTIQFLLFVAIPFLTSALVLLSAYYHPWERQVVADATDKLATAKSQLEDLESTFETEFESKIGNLGAFENVAPNGVERAEKQREDFQDRCEALKSDISKLNEGEADPGQLDRNATDIETRVKELRPELEIEEISSELRTNIKSGIRSEYGKISLRSRYGASYQLVNLPSEYRNVTLPAFSTEVHINEISPAFERRFEKGAPLTTIGDAIGQLENHLKEVQNYIEEKEARFAAKEQEIAETLETLESGLNRLEGEVADRLEDFLREDRHEDVAGKNAVENNIEHAKDLLHEANFDKALRTIQDTKAEADKLVAITEFSQALLSSLDNQSGRISIPDIVNHTLIEGLAPVIEREYDVNVTVMPEVIRVDYPEVPDTTSDNAEAEADTTSRSRSRARPEEVVDSVLYVYRELQNTGSREPGKPVDLQTNNLPDTIGKPEVLRNVESFADRQTDLVKDVNLPEEAPPGFLELTPVEGKAGADIADTLYERYRDSYGQ